MPKEGGPTVLGCHEARMQQEKARAQPEAGVCSPHEGACVLSCRDICVSFTCLHVALKQESPLIFLGFDIKVWPRCRKDIISWRP